MSIGETQPAGRLFPTTSKERIGSYLSWPTGATALSEALGSVEQASCLEVTFQEHWPKPHQGKWPVRFSVLEVEYRRIRNAHMTGPWAEPHWKLCVRPVPREQRAKVRAALESVGFQHVADWLRSHESLHGREGRVTLALFWNSDTEVLECEAAGKAVPEVTTDSGARWRIRTESETESGKHT